MLGRRFFHHVRKLVATPEEMQELGKSIAVNRNCGDIILLDGNVGAGKTCFARGYIQYALNDSSVRVTSPTYLLVNTYDEDPALPIHHVDLYRLNSITETDYKALGFDSIFKHGICLIEWPQRLTTYPKSYLHVEIQVDPSDHEKRIVQLKSIGEKWENRY